MNANIFALPAMSGEYFMELGDKFRQKRTREIMFERSMALLRVEDDGIGLNDAKSSGMGIGLSARHELLTTHWREAKDSAADDGKFAIGLRISVQDGVPSKVNGKCSISKTITETRSRARWMIRSR